MTPKSSPPFAEFIIIIAIMFSLIAFGTDAMLPALPEIAADLKLTEVNRAQLVLTVFVLGTGIGQLFFGPLSDAIGRKPAIVAGIVLFIIGSIQSYLAQSLEAMLVARMIQGLGVSAPRTVTMALVRDLYQGRAMARVMSFSMAVFILVPAVAPLVGQGIMHSFGWRSIFLSFIVFSLIGVVWMWLRQPETLVVVKRRPLRATTLLSGFREVLTNPISLRYMLIVGLVLGGLFGYLSSAQQVFVDSFGVGDKFPLYFAGIALGSGSASFINGMLVMRLGMRRMCFVALSLSTLGSGLAIAAWMILPQEMMLGVFFIWSLLAFLCMSLCLGNLNALAMEPMGHLAGLASAIIGGVATALAVLIAIPIGQAFDGTPLPLMIGYMATTGISLVLLMSWGERAVEG